VTVLHHINTIVLHDVKSLAFQTSKCITVIPLVAGVSTFKQQTNIHAKKKSSLDFEKFHISLDLKRSEGGKGKTAIRKSLRT